jgi:hypothetical protein
MLRCLLPAADAGQLGKRPLREIRIQPPFHHHPAGNVLQHGTVSSIVGIRHHISYTGTRLRPGK